MTTIMNFLCLQVQCSLIQKIHEVTKFWIGEVLFHTTSPPNFHLVYKVGLRPHFI